MYCEGHERDSHVFDGGHAARVPIADDDGKQRVGETHDTAAGPEKAEHRFASTFRLEDGRQHGLMLRLDVYADALVELLDADLGVRLAKELGEPVGRPLGPERSLYHERGRDGDLDFKAVVLHLRAVFLRIEDEDVLSEPIRLDGLIELSGAAARADLEPSEALELLGFGLATTKATEARDLAERAGWSTHDVDRTRFSTWPPASGKAPYVPPSTLRSSKTNQDCNAHQDQDQVRNCRSRIAAAYRFRPGTTLWRGRRDIQVVEIEELVRVYRQTVALCRQSIAHP